MGLALTCKAVALGGLRVSEADRLDFGRLSHVEAVME